LNDDSCDPPADTRTVPAAKAAEVTESGRMGLLDHLEELRKVLIQSLLAMGAAAALCWFWSEQLLDLVIRPVREQGVYFTAPNDAFMARLKVAVVAAVFAVAPFVLFRAYGFVLPGLHRRERRVTTPVLVSTVLLFYIGVAFAFFVVAPYVIKFMMGFGTESLKPLIGVGSYLGFVFRLCLGFGLVFELPMVILGVCVAGIVRPQLLLRTWRYAVVIIAIVSAIFTPPDVISQVMMMVPVLVLYLGSALLAWFIVRKRDRARAAAEAAEGD
jgi:sec-independent protein translocase protein TatC